MFENSSKSFDIILIHFVDLEKSWKNKKIMYSLMSLAKIGVDTAESKPRKEWCVVALQTTAAQSERSPREPDESEEARRFHDARHVNHKLALLRVSYAFLIRSEYGYSTISVHSFIDNLISRVNMKSYRK